MRRRLGPALLLTVLLSPALAGCGSDDAGTDTTDPGPSDQPTSSATSTATSTATSPPTSEPTSTPPPDGVEPEVVDVLHATAAGGASTDEFVRVDDEQALSDFVAQFSDTGFAQQVRSAVEKAMAAHGATYAAVASIGCDVPPVDVEVVDDVLTVAVGKVPDPKVECFAPVTTVAVVGA